MMWLAWRQFRTQALVLAGALTMLAIALAIDGIHLLNFYDTTVATCARRGDCASVTANFLIQAKWHIALNLLVQATPALLGAFWGAPLVAREIETRTIRLAWTQSVTRSRWLLTKVVVVGAASVVATGLLSLMVTWWASPHDRLANSPYGVFDQRDIVPMGYALFAFALGVLLGIMIRRTIPAMAATLGLFAVVRIGFTSWIRPRILSPLRSTGVFTLPGPNGAGIAPPGVGPQDWVFSEKVVDPTGQIIGSYDLRPNGTIVGLSAAPHDPARLNAVIKCGDLLSNSSASSTAQKHSAVQQCVEGFHLHTISTYLPSSSYWRLQWIEAGIFVGGAIALIGVSVWWLRTRIA